MVGVGILFVLASHPVMIISSLMFIVIFYSFMIFCSMSSYWFSYMLMLVLLSGVLVVFTYVMSFTPNESFEIMNLILVLMMMAMLMLGEEAMEFYLDYSSFSLNYWGNVMGGWNVYFISILLVIMVMAVWVSGKSEGSVRFS